MLDGLEQPAHAAQVLHLLELIAQILKIELGALLDLAGQLFGLGAIDLALDFLDQGQHIAHAENSRRHALRMKRFQASQLFADTGELDRLAGDMAHRKCGAAARIAVELG